MIYLQVSKSSLNLSSVNSSRRLLYSLVCPAITMMKPNPIRAVINQHSKVWRSNCSQKLLEGIFKCMNYQLRLQTRECAASAICKLNHKLCFPKQQKMLTTPSWSQIITTIKVSKWYVLIPLGGFPLRILSHLQKSEKRVATSGLFGSSTSCEERLETNSFPRCPINSSQCELW